MEFVHRVPSAIPNVAENSHHRTLDHRVARALRLLEQSMDATIEIETVAREFGLSLHHFHRLFLSETGETPAGYLRRIRLDTAALRLCWTRDSVGTIATLLGYASQAAFTRAFQKRFKVAPGRFRREFKQELGPPVNLSAMRQIRVRDVDSFRVLAKRYIGDLYRVRDYWLDFAAALPDGIATRREALFLGLLYDDPRFTPAHQTRYDCCVTVGDGYSDPAGELRARGLHITSTRAGRHACLQHVGSWQTVADSYGLLTDQWLTRSCYGVADDPAIELHSVRRDLQSRDHLSFTILVPLE